MTTRQLDNQVRTVVPLVAAHIRHGILSGELQPGEKINQDRIAADLGVSRMPVREAMIRLAEAGFVIIHPHRGAVVAPMSAAEIEETYLIRTRLETLAARLAAANMTPQRLAQLEQVLNQADAAIATHDHDRLFELNREFHRLGYEASGRPQLCALIEELRDRSERYRRQHAQMTPRTRDALAEHRQILTAWQQQDADAAERWVEVNMENSARALLAGFVDRS